MTNEQMKQWFFDAVNKLPLEKLMIKTFATDSLDMVFSSSCLCRTCGIKVGRERLDHGLSCGIHCDKCFDRMISEARSKSW